ncbi:MAG: YciI family protein [Gemmataceae bacterium]
MKFAAIIEYSQDRPKVEAHRPARRQYLTTLLQQGKLAATGPFTDDSGALIVYEADTPEQAEALLKADPFHAVGVFLSWRLRPWRTVFANRELFPA